MTLTLANFFLVSAIILDNSSRFFKVSGSFLVCLAAFITDIFLGTGVVPLVLVV